VSALGQQGVPTDAARQKVRMFDTKGLERMQTGTFSVTKPFGFR
jgi:hypothetical protein